MCHPRTDLALEESERLRAQTGQELPGVSVKEEQEDSITITRVHIFSREGEELMGKVQGNYITIEAPRLKVRDTEVQEKAAQILARELGGLMQPLYNGGEVLVVGLGNWQATPDALGPHVVENLLITRHLKDYLPKNLGSRLRPVCAVAPGVLGTTGIESSDIIAGVIQRVRPGLVIVIDALAARNVERIITSIQLSDTGIHPGSGVGNRRVGLTRETLGVPVMAIGVPTVVHAITIAANAVDILVRQLGQRKEFYGILASMSGSDKNRLIDEVLSPTVGDLMVTPKEIDVYIEDMARVLASGLNAALQPGVSHEELLGFLH
ncbi:MAG: GPR endopeptidase [Bacillota bacterium]